jgi:hypothetical protein
MKLYAEQVSQLLATEKNLRLQLTADGEKFQQFQVFFIPCHILPCNIISKLYHHNLMIYCVSSSSGQLKCY